MKLTTKEKSVQFYLRMNNNIVHSSGRGAYIPSIERTDKQSRNGYYIKLNEMTQIFNKLKQYNRLEKIIKLNGIK